ncbi:hypothetical protein [Piscinibacter sp.]|uniref:hypothetical protein n=1 Tax=Piscinibacter sp. TaxID=1903157 RepID=UPI002C39ED66|nr:hypothetical protein [Albitalea sp.]HUG21792.1 hypothetical protein [Albitalea sp.]
MPSIRRTRRRTICGRSYLPAAGALAVLSASLLTGCAIDPFDWGLLARNEPLRPPAGALSEDVTQANIRRTICTPRWTASVRPPASVTDGLKARLVKDRGLRAPDAAKHEIDYLIPLALGGHPRRIENVWLLPRDGEWSARTKDRLEAKLHQLVCSGEIPLQEAQEAIRTDWKLAARYYLSDRELLAPLLDPVD